MEGVKGCVFTSLQCGQVLACASLPSPCTSCFNVECASKLLPACLKENQGARFARCSEEFPCGPLLECGESSVEIGPCNSPSFADGVLAADGIPCSHASLVAYKARVCILLAFK